VSLRPEALSKTPNPAPYNQKNTNSTPAMQHSLQCRLLSTNRSRVTRAQSDCAQQKRPSTEASCSFMPVGQHTTLPEAAKMQATL
jgi:hypothetical protein